MEGLKTNSTALAALAEYTGELVSTSILGLYYLI